MTEQSVTSCREPVRSDPEILLPQALERIESLGPGFAGVGSQLLDLHERLQSGRFHLAVLGQFKRGKSTLLNALLGEEVLPTAVVPVTAIPTFLKPGHPAQVAVHFQDGRAPAILNNPGADGLKPLLSKYVAETENPRNHLGISHVEVTLKAPILEKGVVFIDTPGIGSTFRHNTEATLNFLPQCDAAMFLISADPPITEVEIEFLRRVRERIPRLFFLLNKVDYLSKGDREAALQFLRRMLAEQAGIDSEAKVFCVSAKSGLHARRTKDSRLWEESGLKSVQQHLVEFLASEKSQALRDSVAGKARELIATVLMRLRLERRSLEMPLEELQERLSLFERGIEKVTYQRQIAGDLLTGDCKRMLAFLEEHAATLRAETRKYMEGVIRDALARNNGQSISETLVQSVLAEEIPGWFEHQSGVTTELFRQRIAEVLRLHQERADELIETIRRKAADIFDIPYQAPESSDAFAVVRQPYWITHQWSSRINPLPKGMVDSLLPEPLAKRRVQKRVNERIDSLVLSNVENLRWATFQSISESFRRFGSVLDERLSEVLAGTRGAIRAAMEERARRGEAVKEEIDRLDRAIGDLASIETALTER